MKKTVTKINELCFKSYVLSKNFLPLMGLIVFVLMVVTGVVHADDAGAVDHLAKVKPGIQKTFGHGSTFEWIAYIGEGVVCLWRYLSTQNVAWFVGMPIVMLFTYAFLN